jgi:hypothetical protein
MSIITAFSKKINPQVLLAMLLIIIVVAFLNVAALYASSEHSGYRAGNDPQTMKRESGPVSYLVALDASLLYGDSRMIDWERVQWPA